jgi:Flp pilus assembly protein TadG
MTATRHQSDRDRGTAGVEAAFAVTALLLVGFFIVGALRVTNTAADANAAARAGARAAAAEYDTAAASAAASRVAATTLDNRGVACAHLSVSVGGSLEAGGIVTVDVTCVVSLRDVMVAGFPGTRTVSGRGVEQVDVVRGGA